jgi:hypothetical protein
VLWERCEKFSPNYIGKTEKNLKFVDFFAYLFRPVEKNSKMLQTICFLSLLGPEISICVAIISRIACGTPTLSKKKKKRNPTLKYSIFHRILIRKVTSHKKISLFYHFLNNYLSEVILIFLSRPYISVLAELNLDDGNLLVILQKEI